MAGRELPGRFRQQVWLVQRVPRLDPWPDAKGRRRCPRSIGVRTFVGILAAIWHVVHSFSLPFEAVS
jgi:hypothetical protein